MSIEHLNDLIDNALIEGFKVPYCSRITGSMNAEHALGKYHGLLSIMREMFGIDEMVNTVQRTRERATRLLNIAEHAYKEV